MARLVSVIIPAWNEEHRLPLTLPAIERVRGEDPRIIYEIIVVDDGSKDGTYRTALPWADLVLRLSKNEGKGAALNAGWRAAAGDLIVFLDADLEQSAVHFPLLLTPLLTNEADLVIAELPPASRRGGVGIVKKLAGHGVHALCGRKCTAPLSGQRAMRREVLERCGRSFHGFGVEVGMLIDASKLGFRIMERPIPFAHRETGRDLDGWMHRGKQFFAVGRTLWKCWRTPVC